MFNSVSNTACNNILFTWPIIGRMHPTTERLYAAAKKLKGIEGQSAVAHLLNESPQVVKNWEARGVSSKGVLKAAAKLGCRPDWLHTGQGDMVSHLPRGPGEPRTKPTAEAVRSKVQALPKKGSPLVEELLAIVGRMAEPGIHRLIERATVLAEQYPRAQPNQRG